MSEARRHAAPGPLRDRLRSLGSAAAGALRRLHGSAASWSFDEGGTVWTLAFAAAPSPAEAAMRLQAADAELIVALAGSAAPDVTGARAWWEYEDEARVLAWTLAHENWLRHLADALGIAPLPQGERRSNAVMIAAFDFHVTGGDREWRGRLGVDSAALDLIARRARARAPAASPWRGSLPLRLAVQLPTLRLALAELRPCACGDVLVLGPRAQCLETMTLQIAPPGADTAWGWGARWRDRRLTITSAGPVPQQWRDAHMTQEPAKSDEARPAPAMAAATLGEVPMRVDFELAQLTLTVAELERLQPGYVFELPQPLDGARLLVRANGRVIGRGELVALGDLLGVQLLELDLRGTE